jgi:hypothetical protein
MIKTPPPPPPLLHVANSSSVPGMGAITCPQTWAMRQQELDILSEFFASIPSSRDTHEITQPWVGRPAKTIIGVPSPSSPSHPSLEWAA